MSEPFYFKPQPMQFMFDLAKSLLMLTLVAMMVSVFAVPTLATPQTETENEADTGTTTSTPTDDQRSGVVIRVPLPITLSIGQQIQRTLQVVSGEIAESNAAENRPVVMLEFETDKTETGCRQRPRRLYQPC